MAHIRVGLHAQEQDEPVWQYTLLDCGATDNLISLKAVTFLPNFDKHFTSTRTSAIIKTENNDTSHNLHCRVSLCPSLHNSNGKCICYHSTFLINSGLIHDNFLGQPYTSSTIFYDSNQLCFYSSDKVGKEQAKSEQASTLKLEFQRLTNFTAYYQLRKSSLFL